MSWRDRVRSTLDQAGVLDATRRTRHLVRSRGGRTDRQLLADHLAGTDEPRLHLGCGTRVLPGWLNTDLSPRTVEAMRVDASRPLPFDDATFQYVYNEHLIEHLDLDDGRRLLGELARVLRPGGRLRIATPDLHRLLGLFDDERGWSTDQQAYTDLVLDRFVGGVDPAVPTPATLVLNNNVRDWGHRFIYDAATLEWALADAGFTSIERHELQESQDPVLAGIANESRLPAGMVAFETMTFEAVRS